MDKETAYQISPGLFHQLLDKMHAYAICYNHIGTVVYLNSYTAQKLNVNSRAAHSGSVYDFLPDKVQIPLPGKDMKPPPPQKLALQASRNREILIKPAFELIGTQENPVMLLTGDEMNEVHQALETEHARFFAHYENFAAGAVFLGADNRIIDINSAFKEMFQYSLAEIRGKDIDEVVTQGSYTQEARRISESVKYVKLPGAKARRYRRDGTALLVEIRGLPLFKDGQLVAMVGIYHDITAREEQKEKLRLFKKAFEVALDGIIITGPYSDDNPVIYANPQ